MRVRPVVRSRYWPVLRAALFGGLVLAYALYALALYALATLIV